MINAPGTTGTDTRPDPEQDRPGKPLPARANEIFFLVRTLADYGRHLAGLLGNPTLWRGFTTVARFFGTVALLEIIPRIHRGLMRAAALEAMLLRRTESGRDLVVLAPVTRGARKTQPVTQPPEEDAPARKAAKTSNPPLTHSTLPTLEEIEAEVRRRPIGCTIAAICLDLGISPTLCSGPFWNRIFEAMQDYRGSLIAVVTEFRRREEQFEAEEWKRAKLPWPERTREGVRQALGFFIGEDLVDPSRPYPGLSIIPPPRTRVPQ